MSLGAAAVGGDGKSKDGQNGQPSSPALQWLLHNEIVESGEDVFKTDFSDGSMPVLHSMARKGNATAVKHLLSIDTQKITTKLEYGSRVPLHQAAAAKEGRLETCKMLLDHDKTQIHVKTRDGSTPLHMLVQGDGDEASVLQLFIDVGGIDLVKAAKNDRSTLLHLSCSSGHSAFVSTILAMEPSMASMLDGSGRTCLHLAAEKGHAAVAQQHCSLLQTTARLVQRRHVVDRGEGARVARPQRRAAGGEVLEKEWLRLIQSALGLIEHRHVADADQRTRVLIAERRTPRM